MERAIEAQVPVPDRGGGFFLQLAQFPRAFWMVNLMEMLERLAYYGVRVVICLLYTSDAADE